MVVGGGGVDGVAEGKYDLGSSGVPVSSLRKGRLWAVGCGLRE